VNHAKDKNEHLFRQVNERVEEVSLTTPRAERTLEFFCECDQLGCLETVKATRAEYEAVRTASTHFLVLPGHVDRSVEHVVDSNERFTVVEKDGAAGRRAEESDPRHAT
jgi:hypothetical protein